MCACACELPVQSRCPSNSAVPSSGRSSPASVYSKVVLPAPEAPTRKTASLRCTSIEMPRNTSIRRGPMRNERRRSRATNCGAPFSISRTLSRQFKPGNQAKTSLRMRRRWIEQSCQSGLDLDLKHGGEAAFIFSIARGAADPPPPALIDKSKRNQRRPIDRASHIQPVIELIICNRLLSYRSEHAINRLSEIAELLQRVLHVGDDLVRRQTIIPIDRPIVCIVRIIGIVAVSGIPIPQVPRVKPAAD